MNNKISYQVAFITGQSNPNSWRLSPTQAIFLSSLGISDEAIVHLNFPYVHATQEYRAISLPMASMNNILMYINSRSSKFKARYLNDFKNLIERAQHTIFLAGSCGLELLANMQLGADELMNISVFAYGPVARSIPGCSTFIVQGRSDWLSRYFFSKADHLVDCSHMNYLNDPNVLSLCRKFITTQTNKMQGNAT